MIRVHPRAALSGLLLLCLAPAGCGLSGPPAPSMQPLSPVREFITTRTPGSPEASGTISDPEFGADLRITLEQEFLSAAGETCRRASLLSPRGEAEMVVMCRGNDGLWTLAPRVWGQGLSPAGGQPAPRD